MKKIVIMSDNHGQDMMLEYVREAEENVDYFIHCGDSEASYKELLRGYICVKGNNDWSLNLPSDVKMEIEGHSILITHGQRFGYFNREYAMHDVLT
ncbi:MAG: metallophosphoesterase family protein, partial [Coprobacillus sp.]